jgi:hypothetical protein
MLQLVLTFCAAAANDGPTAENNEPAASRRRAGTQHNVVTVPGYCGLTPESSDCWLGVEIYVETKGPERGRPVAGQSSEFIRAYQQQTD